MLIKGGIPKKEPTVSIGLVLPEDQKTSISITDIESNTSFEVDDSFDGKHFPDSIYKLDSVRAGRGFHWEKQISITVESELEIKIVDGFLFVINHIPLEKYLVCVATSEMSGECPPALLEAQTVAARSWLLAAAEQKHADLELDACNDDCCQRYQGIGNLTEAAISATNISRGKVLTYKNKICDTRYSKSCGGVSENNELVWNEKPKPYLRAVLDSSEKEMPNLQLNDGFQSWLNQGQSSFCSSNNVPESEFHRYLGHVDQSGSYFRWEVSFTHEEITKLISDKTGNEFESIHSLQSLRRGASGRIIELQIDGIENGKPTQVILKSEYEIRRVLHPNFLYSSAFIIEANSTPNPPPSQVTFKGAGWGHGVGLCQIGALGMSLNGYTATEILSHYFQSTKLTTIYD